MVHLLHSALVGQPDGGVGVAAGGAALVQALADWVMTTKTLKPVVFVERATPTLQLDHVHFDIQRRGIKHQIFFTAFRSSRANERL
jgi:hypothetical protein